MTPAVYENLAQLTYGELLSAIDRLREKMYDAGTSLIIDKKKLDIFNKK